LQLQTTPWLAGNLEKRNIKFYRQGSKVLINRPYVSHSFKTTKAKTGKDAPASVAQQSGIGVKTDEHSPASAAQQSNIAVKADEGSPAPAAQPSDQLAVKTSFSHLGILLLELCFWQTIESREERRSYLEPDGQPSQFTNYMAAQEWEKKVLGHEPELAPVIKMCCHCDFLVKADWEDKSFVQAAYTKIVEPLEKIINKWPK
jgi:hypothetical protein